MSKIHSHTELVLSKNARHRSIGSEGVVMRQQEGEVMVVNQMGTDILNQLEQETRADEIIASLDKEYDVDIGILQNDVFHYLNELYSLNVIEIV